jgi:hypothetical protein
MKLHYIGIIFMSAALLISCREKSTEEKVAEAAEAVTDDAKVSVSDAMSAMKKVAEQAEESQKNGPVETVDFRTLKELLPADADGLARKSATGEKAGAMGFKISTANGEYANSDGSERIELTIVDAGGTGAMMGMAAWSMIDVDKETENGYEKTGKMGDNKSYEKYDNSSKSGEIAVLVNNRFIVTAKGNGVSMDKIKATLEDIDLDKLGDMK